MKRKDDQILFIFFYNFYNIKIEEWRDILFRFKDSMALESIWKYVRKIVILRKEKSKPGLSIKMICWPICTSNIPRNGPSSLKK
jgi:hypothetical protein